jgi:hypothetical protein
VYVEDKQVMNLLAQYAKHSVEYGGLFTDFTQGISSGCSLSPLISSFYLYELDKEMENKSVFYRRYMDDVIALSTTRWKLRKAIRVVNQHFAKLKFKQHPDKTTIGRIKSGFDFLGYQFGKKNNCFKTHIKESYLSTNAAL